MDSLKRMICAAQAVNLYGLRLALRKPAVLRSYISQVLRKYDELAETGLPIRGPFSCLPKSEAECVTIPSNFIMGNVTCPGEMLILGAVTRLLKPQCIFEIGTYRGRTTAVFALNAPPEAKIITLDLPPAAEPENGYLASDVELMKDRQVRSFLCYAGQDRRYTQIYCDSMQFDPSPYRGQVELGFIDGAHAYKFVKNDTEKMAVMMAERGLVFWHDYGGRGSFAPLTGYLESLPIAVYRIRDTSLAWSTGAELKKLVGKQVSSNSRADLIRPQAV